jgi:hypothetical protein
MKSFYGLASNKADFQRGLLEVVVENFERHHAGDVRTLGQAVKLLRDMKVAYIPEVQLVVEELIKGLGRVACLVSPQLVSGNVLRDRVVRKVFSYAITALTAQSLSSESGTVLEPLKAFRSRYDLNQLAACLLMLDLPPWWAEK